MTESEFGLEPVEFQSARRRWLVQAGVIASSAALHLPFAALGQTKSTLNALPRLALVIGNSRYSDAPLKNAANDAKAIAGALEKTGFHVQVVLEASRAQMAAQIAEFSASLAKQKGVGLFYYAGHGVQLAWRNYIIPVDAAIDTLEDMQTRAVDLSALLAGLNKAQNPMNVIILDACRDNPFGSKVQVQQKGLSQFDAPPGSLLAYATAPGNVAADGEGAHGLYTESLLRELAEPEAKIEDVFKRVRLSVRRKSEGRQIPWESTSLEDDFYFLPPQHIKKLSEAELEKQFTEEAAVWEKAKEAKESEPIEDYLRRYPSGKFSELAQFRLDRLLREKEQQLAVVAPQPVAAPQNPFSKGTARVNTRFTVGDTYSYVIFDLYNKLEISRRTFTVTSLTEDQVVFNENIVNDLMGNLIVSAREKEYSTARQFYVGEYSIGKKWTTRYKGTNIEGTAVLSYEHEFKVVAKEQKTVPAGTFDTYRVEGSGWASSSSRFQWKYWIAPDVVRKPIAFERVAIDRTNKVYIREAEELTSYRQAART